MNEFRLSVLILFWAAFSVAVHPQVTSSRTTADPQLEVARAQNAIDTVIGQSGEAFKEGLDAYLKDNRPVAAERFNKSIEVFLFSSLNIQREQKLQACYNELIETIYHIEFPTDSHLPQIRNLAVACSWNIDAVTADNVARIAKVSTSSFRLQYIEGLNAKSEVQSIGDSSSSIDVPVKPLVTETPQNDVVKGELPTFGYGKSDYIGFTIDVDGGRVVKARAGDTVARIAERLKFDPATLARYNDLLPTSLLAAGREIKIPGTDETWQSLSDRTGVSISRLMSANPGSSSPKGKVFIPEIGSRDIRYTSGAKQRISILTESQIIGPRPAQSKNGQVRVVVQYFNENLHDPYSMRFLRWSPFVRESHLGEPYWKISVRYRAKNLMGAYKLSEMVFLIRHNRIIRTVSLD